MLGIPDFDPAPVPVMTQEFQSVNQRFMLAVLELGEAQQQFQKERYCTALETLRKVVRDTSKLISRAI